MKLKNILLTGLMLGLLPACVPSVNPLYTEKDLVFDPALVGEWSPDGSKETWRFEKVGEKRYGLTHTDDDGRKAEFDVRLVKLKKHRFLDLYLVNPGGADWKPNNLATFSMIVRPGHMFMKVTQIEPELELSFLDPDWLEDLLKEDPKAIRHERLRFGADEHDEGRLVLTAGTRELQRFVLKYADDEKAFGSPSSMERQPAPITPESPVQP